MKSPFGILRIVWAITLILVITLFPHHHHDGDVPCWSMEKCETDANASCHHHQHRHSTPCNGSLCYLQSTKNFVQGERGEFVIPLLFLEKLRETFSLDPFFLSLKKIQIPDFGYLLPDWTIQANTLRGPPTC